MNCLIRVQLTSFVLLVFSASIFASEVVDTTHTQVVVREHPKTHRPYVSIVSNDEPVPRDPFTGQRKSYSRPDYRMLDPKVKNGEIFYDGPSSDNKKIYIFAASLMTIGVVGGAVGMAAAPAATGATASGGGAYLAAGSAVAGSAAAAGVISSKSSDNEKYKHESESLLVRLKNEKVSEK